MTPTVPPNWQRKLFLPGINPSKRNHDADSIRIVAHFMDATAKVHFYVAEGDEHGNVWMYWGFAVIPGTKYGAQMTVPSTLLESGQWYGRQRCKLDNSFDPKDWKAIKLLHFKPSEPLAVGRLNGKDRKDAKPKEGNGNGG